MNTGIVALAALCVLLVAAGFVGRVLLSASHYAFDLMLGEAHDDLSGDRR